MSITSALLPPTVITTAVANQLSQVLDLKANHQKLPLSMAAQAKLTYGSGGTTVNVYIQTSFDNGVTWNDVMNFSFTTSTDRKIGAINRQTALVPVSGTDGTLTANTKNDGIFGTLWRAKYTTTGTYAGNTTLEVDLVGEN